VIAPLDAAPNINSLDCAAFPALVTVGLAPVRVWLLVTVVSSQDVVAMNVTLLKVEVRKLGVPPVVVKVTASVPEEALLHT
jgi:hypothetical protein